MAEASKKDMSEAPKNIPRWLKLLKKIWQKILKKIWQKLLLKIYMAEAPKKTFAESPSDGVVQQVE